MITADLLTQIPLFARIPEAERTYLAARASDIRLLEGEWLLREGQAPAFFALLEGRITVYKFMGWSDQPIASYGPGDYFGEVPLVLGSPAIASLQATEPARLMRFEADQFHELISECKVLNGQILGTMHDRVRRLQELVVATPTVTATVLGPPLQAECYDLRDFLARNRVPYRWVDSDNAEDVEWLINDGTLSRPDLEAAFPLVILKDGRRLSCPGFRTMAETLGLQTAPNHDAYDVTIVGGGPAGLAAAVYGASEGLRTLLVEKIACGGQAGTSQRIENYLGFPAGLSGDELSGRAWRQARQFGAELLVARSVIRIEPGEVEGGVMTPHTVVLDDGTRISSAAVILAAGVQWRQLDLPGMHQLSGHGVYYGASRADAMRLHGRTVHLVGGGNSAGQAALLFAGHADSVTMLVRGPSLAASMSDYLIKQLQSKTNVTIENRAEVVAVEGNGRLEAIEVECAGGRRERRPSDGLFVFIGARAETSWLPPAVIRDQWDYVCTGRDVMDLLQERTTRDWPLERDPYLLETSVPGIFAAGDVRHGSIKRCASAVGEGSMAIAFVHQYLAESAARGVPV